MVETRLKQLRERRGLGAAWQIRQNAADCCIATRVSAAVFGLEFTPLVAERYDLVASAAPGTPRKSTPCSKYCNRQNCATT